MDISRISLSVGIFTGLLQYLPKKTAILVPKSGGRKKKCKNPFPAIFKTKKKFKKIQHLREAAKKVLRGGWVKGRARPLSELLIVAASLSTGGHNMALSLRK